MRMFLVLGCGLCALGCLDAVGTDPKTTGTGGGTGSGGTGGADGLPCVAADLLASDCASCHGPTLAGSAPMHLVTRADLAAASSIDPSQNFARRSVLRMRASSAAMPPAPAAPVAEARVAAFEAWVNDGMPAGQCLSGPGDGTGGGSGGAGGSGGGGGVAPPYDGGIAGLPCDVAAMVAAKCAGCHRSPPTGGATFALLSRADFLAVSGVDPSKNEAQRSMVRLASATNPMPPAGSPAVTAGERAAFEAWVNSGTPVGNCGAVDAGSSDAGAAPTTCSSGTFWTNGNTKSESMNPGLACRTCHVQKAPFKAFYFSGTAYSTLHEQDTCNAVTPPAGTKIEIIDSKGAVAQTLTPNAVGNFHYALIFNLVSMPYTARITANGKSLTMTTPQSETDCNSCHTEQGANGAPGRIVWPL